MKAVILAGGKGTRLYPYTTVFPKPLVPLDNKPIVEIIIRQLAYRGFKEIILSVGYLAELIQAYFKSSNNLPKGVTIKYIKEKHPMGTAGSLAMIPNLGKTFLVMNGDILTTLDYSKLVKFHEEKEAILTIAMHRRDVKIDLGLMEVDRDSRLKKFFEKPTMKYLVSMGIYVYDAKIFKYLKKGERFDFPELVLKLFSKDEKVVGYESSDYWLDLGSHDDYAKAVEEFKSRRKEFLI